MGHRDKPWALIVVEAKPVPGPLDLVPRRRCARVRVHARARVCVPHRGGSPADELPRSFIGLPVIMIMPRGARGPPKSRKGRDASSPVFCAARRPIFCLQGTKTFSIGNGGWWSHRYVKKKKSFASWGRETLSEHERETTANLKKQHILLDS